MSEAPESIEPGVTIAGRYRIERSIASGGMAEVYEAKDMASGKQVALKLLKPEIARNVEAAERLRREGEVLKSLSHPAIVELDTFGKLDDGRLFIAMELLAGETLGARMRTQGQLDTAELVRILAGACAGLAAAHERGIVHRDLKPDNIFLVDAPNGVQVKLLDFGISKITGSDKLTQTGEVLGTPRYMAPEQLSAERDLDGRTDVYALGVILYEALAGKPPFLGATPSDLIVAILHGKSAPLRSYRPDLPTELDAVVSRCIARARDARYGSAPELLDAFVAALGPIEAPASANKGAREGMATAVLGSMGDGSASGGDPGRGANGVVHAGTFSALAQPPGSAMAVPAVPAAVSGSTAGPDVMDEPDVPAPAPMPADPGATTPARRKIRQPGAQPHLAQAAPVAPPEPATRVSDAAMGVAPMHAASSPGVSSPGGYRVPMRGNRTLLIVGGLIAGAVSAAIAIGALQFLNADDEPEPEVETAAEPSQGAESVPEEGRLPAPVDRPPAEPTEAPGGAAPEDNTAEDRPQAALPGAPDGTTQEPAVPTPSRRRVRTRGSRIAGMSSRMSSGPTAGGLMSPSAESPAALVREARAALSRGDARACVERADRAISAGAGSLALRLRGDCMLRMGDRAEARKSYERFCRLARDHPAISEVRAIVEGLGGRCD